MSYEYNGVQYDSRQEACLARRLHYLKLVSEGANFTQAAKTVGVSKRTGKAWRNGRKRANGRNEQPLLDVAHALALPTASNITHFVQS